MWLLEDTARCDSTNGVRTLHRWGRDRSLSDGHLNRRARIPLVMKNALHPLFRRHEPGLFRGQVNAGFRAKPQHLRVFCNGVDAHALAHVIEEDVARMHNRVVQAHCTMASFSKHPALELAPVESSVTWTKCRETLRYRLGFQHRRGHHNLEDRAWRKLRMSRAIEQWAVLIAVQPLPFFLGNTHREIVGIR